MRRTLTTLAAVALALAGTTACEPPPPPTSLTVNVAPGVTGDDANPGDGICETAPGNGECTLDAAVQEGNTLGRADIHVPPATAYDAMYRLSETTITGSLNLFSSWTPSRTVQVVAPQLHVAAGGHLALEQAGIAIEGTAVVDGVLSLHRSFVYGWIDISATGVMSMVNSDGGPTMDHTPVPPSGAWITNRGTFVSRFSAFARVSWISASLFHTLDGGGTQLGASVAYPMGTFPAPCLGTPPVSEGYNLLYGCALTGPGDVTGTYQPNPTHAVPNGVVGCGTTITVDINGDPRPDPDSWQPGQCNHGPIE